MTKLKDEWLNKIYKYDCVEGMRRLPDECIDLILTDPPYKITQGGAKTKGKHAMGGSLKQGDDNVSKGKIFNHNDIKLSEWVPEVYRLLKDGGFFYCYTNSLNMSELLNVAKENKFKLNNILIMIKDNCVVNQWYMKNVEYVCFFRKGKAKPLNDRGIKTAVEVTIPKGNEKIHPTQKPEEYIKMLVKNSTQGDAIVLDPFMGSGTTAKVCKELNIKYLGFEIDKKIHSDAENRLKSVN